MAEPVLPQTTVPDQPPPWTTWEELLLACAVHRHGTAAWDSVAAEVQKRSTTASAVVSAANCREKYLDLKNRYSHKTGSGTVPWLDELRSTRVRELKQEVHRCDLSIVSLQLKVKRLKEERESGESSDPTEIEKAVEPVEPVDCEPVSCEPVGDESCNGSSDSVERKPECEAVKVEAAKESSDLQSSAGESGGEKAERNEEEGDPAVERGRVVVERSRPLVRVLEMVRAYKVGSAFERREVGDHKSSIRQPIDIETIHTRLEEGCYSDCNKKFFRDLLLLFTNATLSFAKNSVEFAAAVELRKLISKELCLRNKKSDSSTREQTISLSSKPDPEPSDSLVLKPKILGPIIVCRKRSSIASKISGSSSGDEKKKVRNVTLLEDKPLLDWKQSSKSSANADENENTKKRTSDRFVSSSKSSIKIGKNQNQARGSSPKELIEPKTNKNSPNVTVAKKRNVTSTNKNKQKTSTLLESLKDSEISPNNAKGGTENKKSSGGNGRGEKKREQKGRQVKERESPIKRINVRLGKRGVAAAPPPPVAVSGKRNREGGDAEVAASSQPKKRSRR